ncbi:3-hydroxy-9,10-secoandrosta-1,3,5(10)-triene-9,17-dione monooxygenase reductase subunit [Micromonospora sp. CPCC 206061]|uniref:3-hydroxy-9,10-secoandrosta-1,3,5(10)-triene-9, 17-dione monooxygenase reductase subunit n=1 Tax=Micromonospora sp. CPCC 206061 TaxID=3122410 RepID=UPI002FF2F6D3
MTAPATVDTDRFRRVFGHFCTGVTVITGLANGEPVGFACQAFAALSLDPPLVLFCPRDTSDTWRRIRSTGHFGVNVLADDQRELSRRFGTAGADRWRGVAWSPSPAGAPILSGVLTWADCRIEVVHPGGDHDIVVGQVTALGECRTVKPLLFYKGRYTATADISPHDPPEVVDTLLSWHRHTDWM